MKLKLDRIDWEGIKRGLEQDMKNAMITKIINSQVVEFIEEQISKCPKNSPPKPQKKP